jgi:choline-sulfatase
MDPSVPVRTPNFERLSERGVWFSNAVCPSPLCGPSRACLASGMEYDDCGYPQHGADVGFDLDATYYAPLRDEADYHVAGCGTFIDKFYGKRGPEGRHRIDEFGFSDGLRNRGKWASAGQVADDREHVYRRHLPENDLLETHKTDYDRRRVTRRDHFAATFPTAFPDDAYCDNWLAENGLDLIRDAPDDRPWHLEVSFVGPHDPLDVTEDMYGWYRDDPFDFPGPQPLGPDDGFDGRTHNEIRRNYAAMVENVDRWVGRYLDHLEATNQLENTLIVFASDQGELLGDHGRWKKHSPYQSSVGVPFVISGPGVPAWGECREPVSLIDAHTTFLDYAGLDPGDVDSRSLRPFLEGESDSHREVVHSGLGPWRVVDDGRYKLVTGYQPDHNAFPRDRGDKDQVNAFFEADEEAQRENRAERDVLLFDRENDLHETQNVAEEHPDVVDRLAAELPEGTPV